MDKNEKIRLIWTMCQARYGTYKLNAGQSENAVKQCWLQALGEYSSQDLQDAVKSYIHNSSYEKWPTEGTLVKRLQDWGCTKEAPQNALPAPQAKLQDSIKIAGAWYHENIVGQGLEKHNALADAVEAWWKEQSSSFKASFDKPSFALIFGLFYERGLHRSF